MSSSFKTDLARYVRGVVGASAVVALVAMVSSFIGTFAHLFRQVIVFGSDDPVVYNGILIEVVASASWGLFSSLYAGLATGVALQVLYRLRVITRHRLGYCVVLFAVLYPVAAYPAYAVVVGVGQLLPAELFAGHASGSQAYRIWNWDFSFLLFYWLNPIALVLHGAIYRLMLGSAESLPYPFKRDMTGDPS